MASKNVYVQTRENAAHVVSDPCLSVFIKQPSKGIFIAQRTESIHVLPKHVEEIFVFSKNSNSTSLS